MAFVDESTAALYREAWDAWRQQLDRVHSVFLGEERLKPDQLKGLLNREARAKEKYDAARLRLLGLEAAAPSQANPDENPFR